jgi:hypothetical protein
MGDGTGVLVDVCGPTGERLRVCPAWTGKLGTDLQVFDHYLLVVQYRVHMYSILKKLPLDLKWPLPPAQVPRKHVEGKYR